MKLSKTKRAEIIKIALAKQFGEQLKWKRDQVLFEYGANDLDYISEFESALKKDIAALTSKLKSLTDEEINAISDELSDLLEGSENSPFSEIVQTWGIRRRKNPPDAAYGFGHPKYEVGFKYWSQMPQPSLHEFTMLSMGANPKASDPDEVSKFAKEIEKGKSLWSCLKLWVKRHDLFRRYFKESRFGYAPKSTRQRAAHRTPRKSHQRPCRRSWP